MFLCFLLYQAQDEFLHPAVMYGVLSLQFSMMIILFFIQEGFRQMNMKICRKIPEILWGNGLPFVWLHG